MTERHDPRNPYCAYCAAGVGLYGAYEWERAKQFDSDYYKPLEDGTAKLIRCPLRLAYHWVRPCGDSHTGECGDKCTPRALGTVSLDEANDRVR